MSKQINFMGASIATLTLAMSFLLLPTQVRNPLVALAQSTSEATPVSTTEAVPQIIRCQLKLMQVGFIDKTGKLVIQPQYDYAAAFSQGLAAVMIDHKMGYIDPTGNFVIQPQYSFADSFSDGIAVVGDKNTFGYITMLHQLGSNPLFNPNIPTHVPSVKIWHVLCLRVLL